MSKNSSSAKEVYRQRRLQQMKRKRKRNSSDLNSSVLHELNKVPDCKHCGATRFEYEPPTFCCDNGKIKLACSEVPNELYELYTSQSKEAIDFRKHIRLYNSMFSFTSFGVTLDKELAFARRGVYSFRAQGMVYHDLPGLIPRDRSPDFFQLYFYDTQSEVENRMNIMRNQNISEAVVKNLMKNLEVNPYAKIFRRLKDCSSMDDVQLRISKDVNLDQRVYNSPQADQVAAIWVEGNGDNIPLERDIVVHVHSGERHRIKHYYGCYDPLQYPLLFPRGENGWHQNIEKDTGFTSSAHDANLSGPSILSRITTVDDIISQEEQGVRKQNDKKVSCREYICYKLQIRNSRQSILLLAGRLLQQFAVDMYIKLETTRLDYIRQNQSNMRAELYQGIVDSVSKGETRGNEVGKRIVLPATFIGGPRDMRRRYLDALALVQKFGKPDLFITMTCNPEWKEIQESLYPGQTAQDRPDLTSRVFRAKLQDLKDQLFKSEIFGHVAAHVHVIEFQKRGLPHVHMLVIFKSEDKINTSDEIDKFVSAELPDEEKNPQLFELVKKHMMHGPCGQESYYYFKGIVDGVQNISSIWYDSCKKCSTSCPKNGEIAMCKKCNTEVVETIPRYRITLDVIQGDYNAHATLFEDVVSVFVGCSVDEYISSLNQGENESVYYRGLSLQNSREIHFLIASKSVNFDSRGNMTLIASAIQKLKRNNIDEETPVQESQTNQVEGRKRSYKRVKPSEKEKNEAGGNKENKRAKRKIKPTQVEEKKKSNAGLELHEEQGKGKRRITKKKFEDCIDILSDDDDDNDTLDKFLSKSKKNKRCSTSIKIKQEKI